MADTQRSFLYRDDDYIYVAWFKHWRNGQIYYARDYGHTAWRIPIHRNH